MAAPASVPMPPNNGTATEKQAYDWCVYRFQLNLHQGGNMRKEVEAANAVCTYCNPYKSKTNRKKFMEATAVKAAKEFAGGNNYKYANPNEEYNYIGTASSLPFTQAGKGVKLDNMPCYPIGMNFPQTQIAPDGRLDFWNFPDTALFTTFEEQTKKNGEGSQIQKPIIPLDANGRIGYDINIGSPSMQFMYITGQEGHVWAGNMNEPSGQPFFYGIPVTPADRKFALEYVAAGRPNSTLNDGKTPANTNTRFRSPWTYLNIRSWRGYFVYDPLTIEQLIFVNIQYMVDHLLKTPYPVFGYVPYGESYPWMYHKIITGTDRTKKLTAYCEGVDFLKAPVGDKTFWDKVLEASPAIMAGIFSIATLGAGAPALVAAAAAMGTGYMQKDMAQKQAIAQSINSFWDGVNQTDNIDQSGADSLLNEGYKSPKLWLILIIAIAAIVGGIYLYRKRKK